MKPALHEIFAYCQGRHYLEFTYGQIKLYDANRKFIISSTHHMEMFTELGNDTVAFEKVFVAAIISSERVAGELLRMEINDMIDTHVGYHTGWDFVTARVLSVDDIKKRAPLNVEYEFTSGGSSWGTPLKVHRGLLIDYTNICGRTACLLDDKLICNGMSYVLKTAEHDRHNVCPFRALTTECTLVPI